MRDKFESESKCRRVGRRVVTGEVLIANHALTSPQNYFGSAKYGATVIFPEFSGQIASTINEAMYAAFEEKGKNFLIRAVMLLNSRIFSRLSDGAVRKKTCVFCGQ